LMAGAVMVIALFVTKQLFAQRSFGLGQAYENKYYFGKAEQEYLKAAQSIPQESDYYEALGIIYKKHIPLAVTVEEKDAYRKKVMTALEKASHLNPYRAFNYYELAFLYERDGDIEKANTAFKRAIESSPTNPLFLAEYGYFAARNQMKEAALDSFRKTIDLNSTYVGGGRYQFCDMIKAAYQVTQDYGDLKSLAPDSPKGHRCLGLLFGEHEQWNIANVELNTALMQARKFGYHKYANGFRRPIVVLYASKGRFSDAFAIFEQDAKGYDEDPLAARHIKKIRRQMKQVARGVSS